MEHPTNAHAFSSLLDGTGRTLLPTLTAENYGSGNNGCPHDGREQYATSRAPSLRTMLHALPRQDGASTPSSGPMNPRYLEWFMGFPIGWSSSDG